MWSFFSLEKETSSLQGIWHRAEPSSVTILGKETYTCFHLPDRCASACLSACHLLPFRRRNFNRCGKQPFPTVRDPPEGTPLPHSFFVLSSFSHPLLLGKLKSAPAKETKKKSCRIRLSELRFLEGALKCRQISLYFCSMSKHSERRNKPRFFLTSTHLLSNKGGGCARTHERYKRY